MSASSRVCPQERAVWRFDARGGYPWGWRESGRIWARFGATFLSLEMAHRVIKMSTRWAGNRVSKMATRQGGRRVDKMSTRSGHDQSDILSLWLDQDLKMRSWFSGAYDMQRSTPRNEALKMGSLFKIKSSQWGLDTYQRQGSNPQNEVLIFSGSRFPRIKASKWGLDIRSFFVWNGVLHTKK